MFDKLHKQLAKRKRENSYRELKLSDNLVDFCSNDYLGISRLLNFENKEPVGSTGSRLLQGNYSLIETLEQELASFHDANEALVYNSGYVANIGLFSCLPQKDDVILYDEYIHASVKDGMRLSFAKSYSFKHNDLQDFEKKLLKLKKETKGNVYVTVESVYSMGGDKAPLRKITELTEYHSCVLVVDEAHAVGVYGKKGEGLVQYLGLENKVAIRVVTFGKAVGCHGAAVLCSNLIKTYLVNFSRSFIYSTALPPSTVAVIRKAYTQMKTSKQILLLQENIKYFKKAAEAGNLKSLMPSDSAVQCVLVPGNSEAKACSNLLRKNGFDVRAILSPTVPVGMQRVRICLHAFNRKQEIDGLFSVLSKFK
ncbi:MAG: 8-amino-7-oxononanoate synthase [Saprospiraceae bacterium]|jgi:8-amino-7-oxononanoate synthase